MAMTWESTESASLAALNSDVLRHGADAPWSIGGVERALLDRYPRADAEEWDRMGLLVGDPAETVTGIAIALDATVEAVRAAAEAGANVLLTHHPAFIDPPACIRPARSRVGGSGAVVWEALRQDVALMNFHTALDASADAANVLPGMLALRYQGVVDRVLPDGRGYGQLCTISADDAPMTLRNMAARCLSVFGRPARVWGDMDARLDTVVTCTGSCGNLPSRCVQAGYGCLVCGEVRYHAAMDASHAGLCIVELGHDVSELPLCAVLAAALRSAGFPEDSITILDQSHNWTTPEAIRK
jgi:putative NIF3 family GTP cyclohydrolase 1 type 2